MATVFCSSFCLHIFSGLKWMSCCSACVSCSICNDSWYRVNSFAYITSDVGGHSAKASAKSINFERIVVNHKCISFVLRGRFSLQMGAKLKRSLSAKCLQSNDESPHSNQIQSPSKYQSKPLNRNLNIRFDLLICLFVLLVKMQF